MITYAVLPVSEVNQYSSLGDLHPWGATTLFSWKLSQVQEVLENQQILVSTDSETVRTACIDVGVPYLMRDGRKKLQDVVSQVARHLPIDSQMMWCNPTFPFFGPKHMQGLIDFFASASGTSDSAVCTRPINNLLIDEERKWINGNLESITDRSLLRDVNRVVPACTISLTEVSRVSGFNFGASPVMLPIGWLESLEVQDRPTFELFSQLLTYYVKG